MEKKTIGRKYEIQSEIARGGMGVVFKALHTQLNRVVAVKVLHEQFSGDTSFLFRFHREARSMARLDHENIIRVFDVADDTDKEQYIVMEYFPGKDLKQIVRENGRMKVGEVISIAVQISKAVSYAHAHGVIHRDIKPANVMVNAQGVVKLADFGIAAANDEASVTSTGQVIGTPEYMSPEQAKGDTLDGRSDLYSVGMVIYEMLHGATPYVGISKMAVVSDLYSNPAEHKLEFSPEAPVPLQEIVRNLVRKKANDRISNAELLISQLTRIQMEWGKTPVKEEDPAAYEKTVLLSSNGRSAQLSNVGKTETGNQRWAFPAMTRWSAAVAGGALLLVLIGTAFYLFTKGENSTVVQTEPPKQAPVSPRVPDKPTVMEEVRNLQRNIRDLMGKVSSSQADADNVSARKLASKEYQAAVDANQLGEEALKGAQAKIDQSQFEAAQPLLSEAVNQLTKAHDQFGEAAKLANENNEKQVKLVAEKEKREKEKKEKTKTEKEKKVANNIVASPARQDNPSPVSAGPSQREIDEAIAVVSRFVKACESKDMNAIQRMSDMTENRFQFFKKIFSDFNKIKLSVGRTTVNREGLKAELTIDSLESKTGDLVTPGKNWKSFQVVIPRLNGYWDRMVIR